MAKHNKKHETPSNVRYASENRLRKNKVRRIMKAQGLSEKEAGELWDGAKTTQGKAKK